MEKGPLGAQGNDRKVGCVTCVSCTFTFILMWQKKVETHLMSDDPILFSLTQGAPDERSTVECGWLLNTSILKLVQHSFKL